MQSRKRRRFSVKTEELEIVKLSDVELQKVQWLWKPYIPFGKITIIQGERMKIATLQSVLSARFKIAALKMTMGVRCIVALFFFCR